ncbi:MAG: hypothetical protein HYZ79_05640 [Candidatus Melainabacteria bacterium]|nr:hypothetical protein [Candidatus Melainabacteria bacterium]
MANQQLMNKFQKSQKAILDQINKVASNEKVKRTTQIAYDYGQKLAHDIVKELQKQGKITAKETKKLVALVNKKSELEKSKLQRNIRNDSDRLLKTVKNVIVNSLALTKKYAIEKTATMNSGTTRSIKRKKRRK